MITATLNSTFCAGSAAACSKGVDNVIHNFAQFIIFTEQPFFVGYVQIEVSEFSLES